MDFASFDHAAVAGAGPALQTLTITVTNTFDPTDGAADGLATTGAAVAPLLLLGLGLLLAGALAVGVGSRRGRRATSR